jgi:hypothetical protein
MMRSVKIGPHFFAKAKNDYGDWRFAIGREFIQNSIDARATRIDVEITEDNDSTTLTFADNGRGMDEDILCNKLLALGESGKDFHDTVGGFGKAKEILYFCHQSYRIHTRDMVVEGSGAEYTLNKVDARRGTESTIVIDGCYRDDIEEHIRNIIDMTQWRGEFFVNGDRLVGRMKKGAFRKELDWCKIYTNKSFVNRMIVRIGGIVMFTRYVDADGRCVVIELEGNSANTLLSSRDSLQNHYRWELDELVRKLTVDKKSAFRPETTYYEHFSGDKLQNEDRSEVVAMAKMAKELAEMCDEVAPEGDEEEDTPLLARDAAPVLNYKADAVPTRVDVRTHFRHDFVLKNNSQMAVPVFFRPGSFSKYSDKLVRCWVRLLLETYRTFGNCEPFSVGFIFEEGVLAEFEQSSDYGRVFYINPAKIALTAANVRVLKKRWGFTWTLKYQLIVTAIHEYVHSLGISGHDERFVGKSDELMAVVLQNLPRFRKCFV